MVSVLKNIVLMLQPSSARIRTFLTDGKSSIKAPRLSKSLIRLSKEPTLSSGTGQLEFSSSPTLRTEARDY
jgi:hypothetical protein